MNKQLIQLSSFINTFHHLTNTFQNFIIQLGLNTQQETMFTLLFISSAQLWTEPPLPLQPLRYNKNWRLRPRCMTNVFKVISPDSWTFYIRVASGFTDQHHMCTSTQCAQGAAQATSSLTKNMADIG
jgi:hypothetical protein